MSTRRTTNREPRVNANEVVIPAASSPEGRHDASLTDFQVEAIAALDRHFTNPGARGLLCLPTGGVKTRTSLDPAGSFQLHEGSRILWATHRVDLLDQDARSRFAGSRGCSGGARPRGFSVSRYQGRDKDLSGDIVLASAATLARQKPTRHALGAGLGVVVYDEAHRAVAKGTWRALSKILGKGEIPFLGLTATPFRSERGGTAQIEAELGGAIYQRTFKDLIDVGFLARPVFVRQQLRSTQGFVLNSRDRAGTERKQDLTPAVLGLPGHVSLAAQLHETVHHWLRERRMATPRPSSSPATSKAR